MSKKLFKFTQILFIFMLVVPWGLVLIFAPNSWREYFGIKHIYWQILGVCSLIGAAIYALPLVTPNPKRDFYIEIFGVFDNILPAVIVLTLYLAGKVSAWTLVFIPFLLYFAIIYLLKHKSTAMSRGRNVNTSKK